MKNSIFAANENYIIVVNIRKSVNHRKLYIMASIDSNKFIWPIIINIFGDRKCLSQRKHITCVKDKLQRPYIF